VGLNPLESSTAGRHLNTVPARLTLPLLAMTLLVGCSADVPSTLDSVQKAHVDPVVAALERYQQAHGKYPEEMNELVATGLLTKVPKLPQISGTSDVVQLEYSAAPDGSFYYLIFGYDFPRGMIGDMIYRYYTSDDKTWGTRKYPPYFPDLVSERFGQRYRDTRSPADLKAAVESFIRHPPGKRAQVGMHEGFVTECLGEGTPMASPPELARAEDQKAVRYDSTGQPAPSYVFVYVTKKQMVMNPDETLSEKDFLLTRAVYRVMPTNGTGDSGYEWKLLAE